MNINDLVSEGAIFYCSHSGGKDSQAMYSFLLSVVPQDQIVVIHADLGHVEWEGTQDHINKTIRHKLNVVTATYKDGRRKTLLNYVRHRFSVRPGAPSWPSAASRWCTSELKTGPIRKFIRADMKAKGAKKAVNCIGIRAEESKARAKKNPFEINKDLSKAGREVWDWMPIFWLSTNQVFQAIDQAGQKPFWIYGEGNNRMSCVLCVLADENDIRNGAKHRPDLVVEYRALEKETGWTVFHKKSLSERINPRLIPVVNINDVEQERLFA